MRDWIGDGLHIIGVAYGIMPFVTALDDLTDSKISQSISLDFCVNILVSSDRD